MATCSARCTPKRIAAARPAQQYLRDLQDASSATCARPGSTRIPATSASRVTQQLLNQANQALDLAQSRYRLGLSSIVELSQAQLNQTQAQIAQASAKYDYEGAISALNYEIGAAH